MGSLESFAAPPSRRLITGALDLGAILYLFLLSRDLYMSTTVVIDTDTGEKEALPRLESVFLDPLQIASFSSEYSPDSDILCEKKEYIMILVERTKAGTYGGTQGKSTAHVQELKLMGAPRDSFGFGLHAVYDSCSLIVEKDKVARSCETVMVVIA